MLRLFVAIDLPDSIKERIVELCSYGLPGVKWVERDQFHLSLRFIGEVEENLSGKIETVLSKIKGKSTSITLKGAGTYPRKKAPRVILLGVEKNEELHLLKKKVDFQLNQIGVFKETRKFSPHVTLGRVKSNKIKRIGDYLVHYDMFRTEPFEVTEFVLFSSTLTPNGAIYKKEVVYQLN